jgi:hypothetical protein
LLKLVIRHAQENAIANCDNENDQSRAENGPKTTRKTLSPAADTVAAVSAIGAIASVATLAGARSQNISAASPEDKGTIAHAISPRFPPRFKVFVSAKLLDKIRTWPRPIRLDKPVDNEPLTNNEGNNEEKRDRRPNQHSRAREYKLDNNCADGG